MVTTVFTNISESATFVKQELSEDRTVESTYPILLGSKDTSRFKFLISRSKSKFTRSNISVPNERSGHEKSTNEIP